MKNFGNVKLSEIIRMEIETIGIDAFDDTSFVYSKSDPEWVNFFQKIKKEKNINIESTVLVTARIKKILTKIYYLMYGNGCTEEQKKSVSSRVFFANCLFGFFSQLKKNISTLLPCDISQDKIARWTFVKYLTGLFSFDTLICGSCVDLRSNEKKAVLYEQFFRFFFKKNSKGFYVPSLCETNKSVKGAFKKAHANLDGLKSIVDTDKQSSLSKVSTSWRTMKKLLLESDDVFKDVDKNSVIQYKSDFFVYDLLVHFYSAVEKYISGKTLSKIIEDFINNMGYYKRMRDYHEGESDPAPWKKPETSTEFIIYEDPAAPFDISDNPYSPIGSFSADYFYYDRENFDDMDSVLCYFTQKKYIETMVSRTDNFLINTKYVPMKGQFSKEDELCFQKKLCSNEKIGRSSLFFFKWYTARIEHILYKENQSSIDKVSEAYLDAYDTGIYFAGPYLKKFVDEAVRVFLEEYRITKRTGRIKEVYQYASGIGLTLQLYDAFKKADFCDFLFHPFEWMFRMWDSGCAVAEIAQFSGLSWQKVRELLLKNKQFLKRNDENSMDDLGRYISQWECDEF